MKKNYNPLIYFILTIILAFTAYKCNGQVVITDNNFKPAYDIIGGGFTIGNDCSTDNFMMLYYEGNMVLTGDLEIQDSSLTIYGELDKNGYDVYFTCPDSELIISETLSINTEALEELTLFPNPTDGVFHVKTKKPFTMIIYDSKLSIVNDIPDLRHAPTGVYLVRITIEGKTFTKRIIKK
jgi:hypothetical protein